MNRAATRLGSRAFATASAPSPNAIRGFGPLGKWLRDQPNKVPEMQKHFQTAQAHTYLKKDTDKFIFMGSMVGVGLGLTMALKGTFGVGRPPARRARERRGKPARRERRSWLPPPLFFPSSLFLSSHTLRPLSFSRHLAGVNDAIWGYNKKPVA